MFETEVAAGAMELDAAVPGWDEWVDLEWLHMNYRDGCMLAHTHGDYYAGLHALTRTRMGNGSLFELRAVFPLSRINRWSVSRGFTLRGWAYGVPDPRWEHLRQAWVTLITARRQSRLREADRERVVEMACREFVLV